MAVSAFPRQVIAFFTLGIGFGVEQHALIDQPLYAVACIAGNKLDGVFVTQAGSGDQRVINV
ncbi:Uncharacterised protein [Serratia fonticola]|uniref:Uncharacterized protein n=1 Tax=Serratia fonticola TaxID=47917 RepID=A0A4U9UFJ8_SERFO|nr:Uncharacterised protein [Serratia fonticola]